MNYALWLVPFLPLAAAIAAEFRIRRAVCDPGDPYRHAARRGDAPHIEITYAAGSKDDGAAIGGPALRHHFPLIVRKLQGFAAG